MTGTGQRKRLAAILAADAAGYSRLMAADESATVATLDSARAVFRSHIESNQGRVIDMAGDSVLAVFDTAAGAVSAALAVQRALNKSSSTLAEDRRLHFRVGVHLGDVIEKVDGTVYGDGVNIAARLEGLAKPGGICVSESIRAAVRGKVDAAFEDLGEQTVKNIAEPVRAYRLVPASGAPATQKRSVADIDLSLPDKPSIAVLAFANMSGDPEHEYFTDGVSEDIITELSRFHSLFVIARNSSFTYKGRSVDVRTVAKELGVRYVLEGSIRRAANRIRVTAQLIDSLTGSHIWAEKYDRVLEDVFEVQEEVTRAIVTAIAPQIQLTELEKARRRRPGNLSGYENAVRAWETAFEATVTSNEQVRQDAVMHARKALAIDPRSTLALTAIATAHTLSLQYNAEIDRAAVFAEAMDAITRAIEADPSLEIGHMTLAWLLLAAPDGPRLDEALRSARRAYALNPNNVTCVQCLGYMEGLQGRWQICIEQLSRALRMSPRDPVISFTYMGLALASLCTGEYSDGVEFAQQGLHAAPEYAMLHGYLAMNYVGLGDLERARAAAEAARRFAPRWVERALQSNWTALRRPEDFERRKIFFRVAAGLEDPGAAEALR
jgi:adenylate cyclase